MAISHEFKISAIIATLHEELKFLFVIIIHVIFKMHGENTLGTVLEAGISLLSALGSLTIIVMYLTYPQLR